MRRYANDSFPTVRPRSWSGTYVDYRGVRQVVNSEVGALAIGSLSASFDFHAGVGKDFKLGGLPGGCQ